MKDGVRKAKVFLTWIAWKRSGKKSRIICVPLVLSYEQKLISVNSLTNIAKFVGMKSNKIYILKLDSLSFLTLITKLQIHLAFGILQNTPAIIPQKIAQVVQRDPVMTKLFERDRQVAKQFERPDVSMNGWPSCLNSMMFLMNGWPSRSNGLIFPMKGWPNHLKGLTVATNRWPSCSNGSSIGNSMICSDIWHKYYKWYFKIAMWNFTSR